MDGSTSAVRRGRGAGAALIGLLLLAGPDAAGANAEAPPGIIARWAATPRAVVWVFGENDLARCRTAASVLRRVNHRYGDGVTVAAVGVDVDPAWIRSFLRAERVRATALSVPRAASRAEYGRGTTPALLVLRHGKIVGRVDLAAPGSARGGPEEQIRAAIQS